MKCSINKKYYFLLLILFFAGGLPAKSFNLDKTKPEDIIRLASYNIRTKGDKGRYISFWIYWYTAYPSQPYRFFRRFTLMS